MKNYIIVGDNNFWYSYLKEVTEKELKKELKNIKENLSDYNNESEPTELYVYEVLEKVKTIKL